jgi:Na+/H+ antiporter NhaB
MTPLFVAGLDPILVFIVVGMLFAVFFLFFLFRRALLSLRSGYDEGRRR